MTSVSYEEIFSDFLGNVTDHNFVSLDKSDLYELLSEYLRKTLSQSYIRRLFKTCKYDDVVQIFTYEMDYELDEKSDLDFVKDVLSKGMVVEWLKPQVRSRVNVAQFIGGKEAKWFSQAQHISEIRGLLEDTQNEVRKMIRDRGYIYNDYLEDK